ncbi:MAG: DNA mismatch repair endonuclease MutL [Deltaproteobacteria bacterium]|nr:MAG: DNA mismatch repair endonuclease MutL [Deltaproteobacteria bacterium]
METKIHVLPEELCNKIAAGEVVERPSSVVKELLENSLDAGASDILIELEAGGKRLIRISDNGCGMSQQDAFLSFERHATSKIRTADDLFALSTLGFRGEALASIASVSRLRLKTSDNDEGLGQQIYIEGGKIKNVAEVGFPQGTSIEVRNLFFNLPARKKFLRKENTELGHVADVVTKQALANPAVSFRLKHNERIMLDLRREKGVRERVAALLGRSLLPDLLVVEQQGSDDLQLTGLISQPQLTRSAASHIYTFINGRYIRDRVVQHAVMAGYRHLLMKGRYPVVVLFLKIDPAQVDINVHPTKHEVRFREQSLVHDFIAEGLQQTLRPAEWLNKGGSDFSTENAGDYSTHSQSQTVDQTGSAPDNGFVRELSDRYVPPVENRQKDNFPVDPMLAQLNSTSVYSEPVEENSVATQYTLPGSESSGFFSGLHILGQYHQSYILCQDGSDLVLIDQHAAHERVGFEKLRHAYTAGTIPSQTLLFPEVLELDFNSATALGDNRQELELLGFEIEPFGGKSFALKAIPQLLENRNASRLVVDVALELERIGRTGQLRESIDEILILMACHSVIRANQALAIVEIKALFQELDRIDFKANCPHGRPVMQRMTLTEIERLFRRQ